MEALQIMKFALKSGRTLNFTEGTHKDSEIQYLENDVPNPPPEGINDLIHFLATSRDEDIAEDDTDLYLTE